MIVVERHHRELGLSERLAAFRVATGMIETNIVEQAARRPNPQGGQQLNHRAGAACPSGGKN